MAQTTKMTLKLKLEHDIKTKGWVVKAAFYKNGRRYEARTYCATNRVEAVYIKHIISDMHRAYAKAIKAVN